MIARAFRFTLLLVLALLLTGHPALAGHGGIRPARQAILLVAFGTSVPEAAEAYANVEKKTREAFPGTEIRWAYTSSMIRDKLAESGQRPDSPALALARLANEGFTDIAVQPLHVVPGYEYNDLSRTAHALEGLKDGPRRLTLGMPLLSTEADLSAAAEALVAAHPVKKGEAVVFIGHGTDHPAGVTYPALQTFLSHLSPAYLVGTIEGCTGPDEIIPRLQAMKVRSVRLVPLMAVAGDHARNDIAGEEPESWASLLKAQGFTVNTALTGLASADSIVELWLAHLRSATDAMAATEQ